MALTARGGFRPKSGVDRLKAREQSESAWGFDAKPILPAELPDATDDTLVDVELPPPTPPVLKTEALRPPVQAPPCAQPRQDSPASNGAKPISGDSQGSTSDTEDDDSLDLKPAVALLQPKPPTQWILDELIEVSLWPKPPPAAVLDSPWILDAPNTPLRVPSPVKELESIEETEEVETEAEEAEQVELEDPGDWASPSMRAVEHQKLAINIEHDWGFEPPEQPQETVAPPRPQRTAMNFNREWNFARPDLSPAEPLEPTKPLVRIVPPIRNAATRWDRVEPVEEPLIWQEYPKGKHTLRKHKTRANRDAWFAAKLAHAAESSPSCDSPSSLLD